MDKQTHKKKITAHDYGLNPTVANNWFGSWTQTCKPTSSVDKKYKCDWTSQRGQFRHGGESFSPLTIWSWTEKLKQDRNSKEIELAFVNVSQSQKSTNYLFCIL